MREVALQIIDTIGDELQMARDEVQNLKKQLEEAKKQLEEARETSSYWFTQYDKLNRQTKSAREAENGQLI